MTTDNPNDVPRPALGDVAPIDGVPVNVGPENAESGEIGPEEFGDLSARLDRLWPDAISPNLPEPTVPFTSRRIAHFDLVRVLGSGAFGVVYLANDTHLDRQVAIKLPRPEVLLDEEKRQRFLSEATLAAKLDHPGIVRVYGADLTSATPYIAAEFCDGPTLAEWLDPRTEPPAWLESVEMLAKVADAVHYAHEQGISHRDLKPANLLLIPNERSLLLDDSLASYEPRVTDFGLAKLADASLTDTRSSLLIGTPHYMAPEQLDRAPATGPLAATDVYSLGVILFELLTGQLPVEGESYIEVLDSIRRTAAIRLRKLRENVPRDLESIVAKCLEKNPAARYSSAAELAADLRRCAEGQQILAKSLGVTEKIRYWCTRPQRVRDAGWFTVWSQLIWAFWTFTTIASSPWYGMIAASEVRKLALQIAAVLLLIHLPLAWVGLQTVRGKPWARWLGLGLTLINIPAFIISIVSDPLIFKSLYNGENSYFSFIIYFMLLVCFSIQAFLFTCAIAAGRGRLRSDPV